MSGVRVVASAALSSNFDKRYVVVDEATGEVVDDAQGCGYKSAQNAHRAHAYKSMPPKKNTNDTPPNDRPNAELPARRRWRPRIHAPTLTTCQKLSATLP